MKYQAGGGGPALGTWKHGTITVKLAYLSRTSFTHMTFKTLRRQVSGWSCAKDQYGALRRFTAHLRALPPDALLFLSHPMNCEYSTPYKSFVLRTTTVYCVPVQCYFVRSPAFPLSYSGTVYPLILPRFRPSNRSSLRHVRWRRKRPSPSF